MYLWMLVWLVTWTRTHSHWEPCKLQCDSNFKRNDMVQHPTLINVCKRGCDLFTVALISTSQPSISLLDRHVQPRAPPLLQQSTSVVKKDEVEELSLKKDQLTHVKLQYSHGVQTPSIIKKMVSKSKISFSATDPSSKTTAEPTSQPVQDHPAEASKETTTTKVPKKILLQNNQIKFAEKKEGEIELKNKSTMKERLEKAKHACRHACVVAYGGALEQEACVVGCHLQTTTATLNPSAAIGNDEHVSPKGAIGIFQHMVFNIASHVGHLVRVSWSWASSFRNHAEPQINKVQGYGSEDLTKRAQMPLFIGLRPSYVLPEAQQRPEMIKLVPNQGINLMNDGFMHFPRPLDNRNHHQDLSAIIAIIREESKNPFNDGNQIFVKEPKSKEPKDTPIADKKEAEEENQQHQLDLLECISRKSGLPRWLIAIAIFVSALVVLWLCFSLTAPPDDIRVVKTKPPEMDSLLNDDEDDYEDSCSEKKKLLARNDDVIKIRIENV